jgi:YggT family protein
MNGYFSEAGTFLISVVFGFYILMVLLRFLLQVVRADFYNPVSQFIVKLTTPVLRPLRRAIPPLGGVDTASVTLMVVLQLVELLLIALIVADGAAPGTLLVLAVAKLIKLTLWIFIIAILAQAILSWVQPHAYNPATILLYQLTTPVLRPIQRRLPVFSGIDLSPLVALVVLNLLVLAVPHLVLAIPGLDPLMLRMFLLR